MMRTFIVTAVLGLALSASLAWTSPFTSAFDELGTALYEADDLTKPQKKAADRFRKKLGKPSTSVRKDIRVGKAATKLEKEFGENQDVLDAIDGAISALRETVQARFDELQVAVVVLPAAKPATKARKLTGDAQAFLDESFGGTRSLQVKYVGKANTKIEAANKQVDRANRPPKGKFMCPPPPAAHRAEGYGQIGVGGSVRFIDRITSEIVDVHGDDALLLTFSFCDQKKQDYREIRLQILGEPEVGTYDVSPWSDGAFLVRDPRSGSSGRYLSGTLKIWERRNGLFSGVFRTDPVSLVPGVVSFTVGDPFYSD